MDQQSQQTKFYKKWWFWVIVLIFFYALGSSSLDKAREKQTIERAQQSSINTRPTNLPKEDAQPETVKEPTWHNTFTFKGTGIKNSEPFKTTNKNFKVIYDFAGNGYFSGDIKRVSDTRPVCSFGNVLKPTKDESMCYLSPDQYFIDVTTGGTYTITIQELK